MLRCVLTLGATMRARSEHCTMRSPWGLQAVESTEQLLGADLVQLLLLEDQQAFIRMTSKPGHGFNRVTHKQAMTQKERVAMLDSSAAVSAMQPSEQRVTLCGCQAAATVLRERMPINISDTANLPPGVTFNRAADCPRGFQARAALLAPVCQA